MSVIVELQFEIEYQLDVDEDEFIYYKASNNNLNDLFIKDLNLDLRKIIDNVLQINKFGMFEFSSLEIGGISRIRFQYNGPPNLLSKSVKELTKILNKLTIGLDFQYHKQGIVYTLTSLIDINHHKSPKSPKKQCECKTLTLLLCKRTPKTNSKFCWQHSYCSSPVFDVIPRACSADKVLHIKTNKCVKRTGKMGKYILK